ncbi:bacteriohemerythrin [Desulfovibrio sp. JC022]|uniref:bacteriohemerythrin n=1 Tax=Desulfovibrio sp. JC022 TaxID=2593642 RepID=UPI0013D46E75|nr:bacteriohemerythrin [Desulfovibrio sp. JC022]NDV23056.1 bacteriohemerythrin [Desulfovibrio sp. JC022]
MALVEWKDEYSIGNELIDEQHKSLFVMLNELAEAGPGEKEGAAYTCLSRMLKYAQEHFRDEEKFMRDNGYPGLADHIKEHEGFIGQVEDYAEAVYNTYVPFQDMLEYLNNWLVGHILNSDQKYMDYISSN